MLPVPATLRAVRCVLPVAWLVVDGAVSDVSHGHGCLLGTPPAEPPFRRSRPLHSEAMASRSAFEAKARGENDQARMSSTAGREAGRPAGQVSRPCWQAAGQPVGRFSQPPPLKAHALQESATQLAAQAASNRSDSRSRSSS